MLRRPLDSRVDRVMEYLAIAFPFLALAGNSPADLCVAALALHFLVDKTRSADSAWPRDRWLKAAIAFWLWALFCSAISGWPSSSLAESLAWMRFPVFAIALSSLVERRPSLANQIGYSMLLAASIVSVYLLAVRFIDHGLLRIDGPLGMEKPGWFLFGFGLPAILWLRLRTLHQARGSLLYAAFVTLVVAGIIASYQVYISLALLLGLVVYKFLGQGKLRANLFSVLLIVAAVGVLFLSNPNLYERYTTSAMERLPWLPSSQYYDYWQGGLSTGKANPVVGVGPDNYDLYCRELRASGQVERLGFSGLDVSDGCRNHPHQRYIQLFAETGVIGLGLFIVMAGFLFAYVFKARGRSEYATLASSATIALLVVNFWPISTYSEAFGQKLNIYYWFHISWALALASPQVAAAVCSSQFLRSQR